MNLAFHVSEDGSETVAQSWVSANTCIKVWNTVLPWIKVTDFRTKGKYACYVIDKNLLETLSKE